ncbi:MAG: helix-turn-helix transcriptional regulator [Gemmatimonadales bacterium]
MTAFLGDLEQLVLLALLRLGPEAHGVAIADELARRAGRETTLGAVYKTLTRLEQKGYVRGTLGEPTPERGGRRKRFYQLTPSGRRTLAASLEAIRRLSAGLRHIEREEA